MYMGLEERVPFLNLKKTFQKPLCLTHSEIFHHMAHWLESYHMTIPNPIIGKENEITRLAWGWGENRLPLKQRPSQYLNQLGVHLTRKKWIINSCCLGINRLCPLIQHSAFQWFPQHTPKKILKLAWHTGVNWRDWGMFMGLGENNHYFFSMLYNYKRNKIKSTRKDTNIEFI